MPHISRIQWIELAIFIACFFAFAYFNQGGGWNQNARFAEVRAMVEEGRFAIDDFLVYRRIPENDDLLRLPVQDAEYSVEGKRYEISWVDMDWKLYPVKGEPLPEGVEKAPMVEVCASGDVAFVPATAHFHPNKPPGTSFFGVPGYFLLYHVEKAFGVNPDHWWTLNLNAWLTTVCSVGLFSALGCVVFFRLAKDFSGGAVFPAVLATFAFAFGTTYLPFGTIFFDHNLTAALLLMAFCCARMSCSGDRDPKVQDRLCAAAGLLAGFAAITNYLAAVAGAMLGLYALLATRTGKRTWRAASAFSLGVVPPLILICWYDWRCFGSPFTLNTDLQNPLFKDPHGVLGMFGFPSGYVGSLLLFSPFRGILFLSPVLVMSLFGIVTWLREKRFAAEARLCLAMFAFFFVLNMCFNGYQAGYSAGPRYLVPGMPFLALPLVVAFSSWRWVTSALGLISIGNQVLLTATDAQNPVGVGGHARVEGRREEWSYNLLADYAWPLFAYGRAWPLLEGQLVVHMEKENQRIGDEREDPSEHLAVSQALESELRGSITRGEASPFLLGSLVGPVSVNPLGVFEGLFEYYSFPPGSPQTKWASFNVGELLAPQSFWAQSRASLLPLLLVSGGMSAWALFMARSVSGNSAGLHSRISDRIAGTE